jgi:hypothetical protein
MTSSARTNTPIVCVQRLISERPYHSKRCGANARSAPPSTSPAHVLPRPSPGRDGLGNAGALERGDERMTDRPLRLPSSVRISRHPRHVRAPSNRVGKRSSWRTQHTFVAGMLVDRLARAAPSAEPTAACQELRSLASGRRSHRRQVSLTMPLGAWRAPARALRGGRLNGARTRRSCRAGRS